MTVPSTDFQVRIFRVHDLDAVVRIEQACYPHPWSAEQFLQEADSPVAHLDLLWAGTVLAGYHCYWLVAGEMQILNIATAPEYRRRGGAELLLRQALERGLSLGMESAWLEVRRSNQGAIQLYQRLGFKVDGVRSGYYRDGEDALLMSRRMSAPKGDLGPVDRISKESE